MEKSKPKRRRMQIGSAGTNLKLILLGDGAVGKTTLVKSWMDQRLSSDYILTVGVDISTKDITLPNGKRVKLTVNDIAGQERFAQFRSVFFQSANIAFLCFDVTRRDSLDNLERQWVFQLIPTISDPNFHVLLIGNKTDLIEQRQISSSEIRFVFQRFKKKYPMMKWSGYIETSALLKHNVNEAFTKITQEYFGILEDEHRTNNN